jgi:hypothetical protein
LPVCIFHIEECHNIHSHESILLSQVFIPSIPAWRLEAERGRHPFYHTLPRGVYSAVKERVKVWTTNLYIPNIDKTLVGILL